MIDFETDIENCVSVLKNGGLILYPTDTVWGLGCDATNELAVEKIFNLKQRAQYKSMIMLVASIHDVAYYATTANNTVVNFLENANRPTTIIYPAAKNVAKNIISVDGTIAIRVVKNLFCETIIKKLGKPLVSTSANISGNKTAQTYSQIDPALFYMVDYTAHFDRGNTNPAQPSSILKWDGKETLLFIR